MKKISTRLAIVFLFIAVALGAGFYYYSPRPPSEAKLIQHFNEHRAAFEQLRNMLQADINLTRVASWGVETRKPFFLGPPTEEIFPTDQYNKYLVLLKQVGGLIASRDEGEHPDLKIGVWSWGWGGKTKHIDICWMNQTPSNQISTLDGYQSPGMDKNGNVGFRHIDQNWYLRVD